MRHTSPREWYYTNHSTKYARYVKFHAARVLVYMGLFQRLGGRVDLFDLKRKPLLFVSWRYDDLCC